MKRDIQVTIKGPRGSGKSTVGLLLYNALRDAKISVSYLCGKHHVAQELSFCESEKRVFIVEELE